MYSPGLVCIKRNDYISLQWTLTLTRVPFVASGFRPVSLATCQPVALPLIGAVKTKVLNKRFVCVSKFCWSHGWLKKSWAAIATVLLLLTYVAEFLRHLTSKGSWSPPFFVSVSWTQIHLRFFFRKLLVNNPRQIKMILDQPHKGVAHCHSQNRYTNQWAETSRPSTYDVRLACSIFRSKTVPLVRSKISQSEIFWQLKLLPYLFFNVSNFRIDPY